MAFDRLTLCSLCCCTSLQGHLLMVRRESARGGEPQGEWEGRNVSVSCPPCLSPPARDTREGQRQREAPHSWSSAAWNTEALTHECGSFSGLWCRMLEPFAGCTGVNRCRTDGNGAALQLATINVSTWILINLQNSIYHTCCYWQGSIQL